MYNDPDDLWTYHDDHYMHCVASSCPGCEQNSKEQGLRVDYKKWSDVDRTEPSHGTARGYERPHSNLGLAARLESRGGRGEEGRRRV